MPNNILIIPKCTARVWINRVCHRGNIKHIIILHCVEFALVAPIRVYAYVFTILYYRLHIIILLSCTTSGQQNIVIILLRLSAG